MCMIVTRGSEVNTGSVEADIKYVLWAREKYLVNTDPQRRCYDGCYFSSEMRWSEWERFDSSTTKVGVELRHKFWVELNDYAVSQRGEDARREFRITEELG